VNTAFVVATGTGTILNDEPPPDTTILTGPPAWTGTTGATFTFSGTNGGPNGLHFEAALDGGSFVPVTSPLTLAGLSQGNHTVYVRAINEFGTPDPTPASYTWVVDTAKPTVTIGGPSAAVARSGRSVTYTVTYADQYLRGVTLTAADVVLNKTKTANGAVSVSATADPGVWTVTVSNLTGNGTLGISLKAGTATDQAGNAAAAAGPGAAFAVDNTGPVVSISSPSTAVTAGGPVVFTVTVTDPYLAPTTLAAGQVQLVGLPGITGVVTVTQTAPNVFRIAVSNITASQPGKFRISLPAGLASDLAGNLSAGPVLSEEVLIFGFGR
jgi:hypothetical protein